MCFKLRQYQFSRRAPKILLVLGASLFLMVGYQNCGRKVMLEDALRGSGIVGEKQIAMLTRVEKIEYGLGIEASPSGATSNQPVIAINLQTSELRHSVNSVTKVCPTPSEKFSRLTEILKDAGVCKPIIPPDTMVCMAYAVADIRITSGSEEMLLRTPMCMAGNQLCGVRDTQLRGLLKEIMAQGCAN